MKALTLRSFAKINLHLQVDYRRPDGFHQLRTVFQTVDLHDLVRVELSVSPGVEITVPGGGAPEDLSNLAAKAALGYLERWAPDRGASIVLEKRVPAGGGLGGGSSNAATVLLALERLLGARATRSELRELAGSLGADVPYFLVSGTCLGVGRGDEIIALPDLAEQEVVLVAPPVEVSTAEVFQALQVPEQRPLPGGILDHAAAEADDASLSALDGFNDLEGVVFERYSSVRSVYNALQSSGASGVRMSGSGATVFASFDSSESAEGVESFLPINSRVFRTRIVSRSTVENRRVVEG